MGNTYSGFALPIRLEVTKALAGSAATEAINLFSVVGKVCVKKIYGIVTDDTTLANMTDCHFNLYDGANVALTKATTLAMSTAVVGALVIKNAAVVTNAGFLDGVLGGLLEGATPIVPFEFTVNQKLAVATYLQWVYTTTDAPIAAAMKFFVEYEGIDGGYLTAV